MRLKNLDLIVSILVAVINVGWALLPNRFPIVSLILALPLVFVLPGYTLTEALFKRPTDTSDHLILKPRLKIELPFKASDRFILSLGLSLAIVILNGFVLNMLPIGLQILSWAGSLAILTTVFSLIAAYRRREMGSNVKNLKVTYSLFRLNIHKFILIGLAIILAILSVWYATINAQQKPTPDFTQFWILPSQQTNDSCAILIGVHSNESTSVTYRIIMAIDGTRVGIWPLINLAPQGEWDQSVSVKLAVTKTRYIEAWLYRADKPDTVYREVHLTLNRLEGSNNGQLQPCAT